MSIKKDYVSCADDEKKHELRSTELQKIVNDDQADRAGNFDRQVYIKDTDCGSEIFRIDY